jgi:ATP-dependent Clp protease ATP-binding subunit ClpC
MGIDDMAPETAAFLRLAIDEAEKRGHAKVEPEHLLWIDLVDENGVLCRALRAASGAAATSKIGKLKDRIAKNLETFPVQEDVEAPEFSATAKRCLQAAKPEGGWAAVLAALADLENHPLSSLFWQLDLSGEKLRKTTAQEKVLAAAGVVSLATDALAKYCSNLNDLCAQGKIHECIGRHEEIREVAIILSQRSVNNPMLLGDPGVGKTAIVEGLAYQIWSGKTLPSLQGKTVMCLDIGSLIAGTSYRSEIENRMKAVMNEIAAAKGSIILFIDEIHTLMGAGSSAGSGPDAANMIKPALARGELWVIGATTYREYRHYIEKDPALVRRFQRVMVPEPSRDDTMAIVRGLLPLYEQYHSVTYRDEALAALIDLSARYIGEEKFPSKAVRLLDRLGAEVAVARSLDPAQDNSVTVDAVARVVGRMSGVPVSRLGKSEQHKLMRLEEVIGGDLFGQDEAVGIVCNRLRNAAIHANNPERPKAVFMFAGPSGVGKTELAKLVARELFGGTTFMTRIDMSEFNDKHNANRLIGAPPGTVGYEEGGVLTEAVKRRPYSLVLLDEFEKAHPDVWKLFLQVFDAGQLTDNQGTTVNFKNTVFVLTTNLCSEPLYGKDPTAITEADRETVREGLKQYLPRELFLRIDDVIVFNPLRREHARLIVRRVFEESRSRILANPSPVCKVVDMAISDEAVELLVERGFEPDSGARAVRSYFDRVVLSLVSRTILSHEQPAIPVLDVCVVDGNLVVRVVNARG